MFDFHRHINKCKITTEAYYCTSSIDEWINKAPLSLGFLFNHKIYEKTYIDEVLARLEVKLQESIFFQIGEIGLDKRFMQIDLQTYFLTACIKLSYKYNRILTVHCVKEYDLLLKILKNNKDKMGPITVIHGFTASYEIAKQLKQLDVLISINNTFLKTKGFKRIKEFDKLGFLIESDWDKVNDNNYNESFTKLINELDNTGIKKYKEFNNEYRTIFKNISSNR